ncbi:hypothetical protein [Pedosphaera parvula]|uniref:Nucleotidyltransferase n=1 Tax=Pedosphaera parvula (strain Ellin514) TaxID=320771 RepID=B9XLY5_PEDPL|nr:hypothetical protein [Pedosphaera parvula]EEF59113.1 hypothetical protein Cflav_PD1605 [Pedosphaera parvula Ellin514]
MAEIESLLQRLTAGKVDFVIVGGFAAVAYGVSLVTQDVDICCNFECENLLRLQSALEGLHTVHRLTPAKLPLTITRVNCNDFKNLYLNTDLGQLDCLGQVLGVGDYSEVVKHAVALNLAFGPCQVLSIDALIKAKEAMNRPRDIAAVAQLRAIKERFKR